MLLVATHSKIILNYFTGESTNQLRVGMICSEYSSSLPLGILIFRQRKCSYSYYHQMGAQTVTNNVEAFSLDVLPVRMM